MAAESSFSAKGKKDVDVEELRLKLQLSETEKEGVFLKKEESASLPTIKWMAVAKLLTTKTFSEASLANTMRSAWSLARDFTFRPVGENLFIIQVFCLGDWKRIMEGGPWIFRGCALMMEEFDGATAMPVTPPPHKVMAWV
jgi:hypothetical protein